MLFDLRSRGRRTTVRIVYGGLSVLFLLAFVGLGVGTGFGSSFNIGELFGSSGSPKSYEAAVAKARKHTKTEPNNPAAWAARVEAELRQSSEPGFSNQSSEGFTAKGKKLLNEANQSWERYLALEPKNPSPALAHKMAQVLGENGAEQPKAEVAALQIVIGAEKPSAILYTELAQYSYQSGNTRQADLAAAKAISLAPKSERARIKGLLTALKKNHGKVTSQGAAEGAEGVEEG
jgi:predicted Zn-dependent protease